MGLWGFGLLVIPLATVVHLVLGGLREGLGPLVLGISRAEWDERCAADRAREQGWFTPRLEDGGKR